MVLYVSPRDCDGGAGSEVVVALKPGSGSGGAPHGLWRFVCCQRRPSLTLSTCRYTRVGGSGTFQVVNFLRIFLSILFKLLFFSLSPGQRVRYPATVFT